MLSLRAPLFPVSLALALGCLLGLDGWISLRVALAGCGLIGLLWWRLGRWELASLAAFYALTACAGLAYTRLLAGTIAPDDLRRLPDEKTFATTQWRAVVVEEPVAELSTHTAHRAFDRTSFTAAVEAWRPTGGRYFAAPVDAPWQQARGKIRCLLVGPAQNLACGDELEFASGLTPIPAPLSPGALDGRVFEAEQGIYYQATLLSSNCRRTRAGAGNFWQVFSYRARDWAYARLQLGLEDDPRIADFLAGMLIGYRQEIPADIEQDFRRTGTLHVFAVSGQNIAELMVVVIVLLQLCGLVRWRWGWTLAPIVLAYCLLTGSPASAVRATVMALAILAAWRLGRPLNALGCWSLALIGMLLWNPLILLDPGAQLSFAVVLALILGSRPFQLGLLRPLRPDPFLPASLRTVAQNREEKFWRWLMGLFGATLAATLASEPITAIDFHQVTPISVLANLIVVPAAGLITIVGTLAVAFSLVSLTWAALLNNANWLFAKILICIVAFLAREPGASINVPDIRAWPMPPPAFTVAPIQDTACLLVRSGGETWLFNTGRENPARDATAHLLQFYGVNRLDGLVLLQLSEADNSGADVIVRGFHPRRLVLPILRTRSPMEKTLPATLALAGHPPEAWAAGQTVDLGGGIGLDVLGPLAGSDDAHAENRALVLLFHAAGQTLLWAGKIDRGAQQSLLARYPNLRADVLVLSPDVTPSDDWLRALRVRAWLQLPRSDRYGNTTSVQFDSAPAWTAWPLDQTGAVDLRFLPPHASEPARILLRPWAALPTRPAGP